MRGKAIYPGSFDVLTYGHLDIIRRGASIFRELVVGVGDNPKKDTLFTRDERLDMLKHAIEPWPNVVADDFSGLTVSFAEEKEASVILRGLRFVSDFEFELQIAMGNKRIAEEIETIFLVASSEFSYISSSMVKQIAQFGGDVSEFVPDHVAAALAEKRDQIVAGNGLK